MSATRSKRKQVPESVPGIVEMFSGEFLASCILRNGDFREPTWHVLLSHGTMVRVSLAQTGEEQALRDILLATGGDVKVPEHTDLAETETKIVASALQMVAMTARCMEDALKYGQTRFVAIAARGNKERVKRKHRGGPKTFQKLMSCDFLSIPASELFQTLCVLTQAMDLEKAHETTRENGIQDFLEPKVVAIIDSHGKVKNL